MITLRGFCVKTIKNCAMGKASVTSYTLQDVIFVLWVPANDFMFYMLFLGSGPGNRPGGFKWGSQ